MPLQGYPTMKITHKPPLEGPTITHSLACFLIYFLDKCSYNCVAFFGWKVNFRESPTVNSETINQCCFNMQIMHLVLFLFNKKVKLSRYRHAGAKGEMRYSFYSFLTSALDGGEWSASRLGRALPPGKNPRYPLDRRLGEPQSRSGHSG
jgi:hypothetical protein